MTLISEDKNIKKSLKIVFLVFAMVALFFAAAYLVFQSKTVQKRLIGAITRNITDNTNADFTIGRIDIVLFRRVILEDVYLSDQNKDTLFFVDKMVARVDSLSFRHKKLHIKNIRVNNPILNIRTDSVHGYNYAFLIPKESSPFEWKAFCTNFDIRGGEFRFVNSDKPDLVYWRFQGFDMIVNDFRLNSVENWQCRIQKLNFNGQLGFDLRELEANVRYSDSIVYADSLMAQTTKSKLDAPVLHVDLKPWLLSGEPENISVLANLKELELGLSDLSLIFPSFNNSDLKTEISGEISGQINDLKGKNMRASVENITHLSGEFYLNGLPDIEHTYIFVNLDESYADFDALRKKRLPEELQKMVVNLPPLLKNIGKFSYKGNFTGFINDFVAYGTAYSSLGTVQCDVLFKPGHGQSISLSGHVSTVNLDIGTILQNPLFGKLDLAGEINGEVVDAKRYNLRFDGKISSVDVNNYRYQNIILDGRIEPLRFKGSLDISDPNLSMHYSGELDLTPNESAFRFLADVENANLERLNLVSDRSSLLSFRLDANFTGKNIDELAGEITVNDLSYRNANNILHLQKAELQTSGKDQNSMLVLKSDLIDAEIKGEYNFMDIGVSIMNFYSRYLPSSLKRTIKINEERNNFEMHVWVKDIEPITKTFKPDLSIQTPFELIGFYRPTTSLSYLEGQIPNIEYRGKVFNNIKLRMGANSKEMYGRVKVDQIHLGQGINLYNPTFEGQAKNDELALNIFWNNFEEKTYSGSIKTLTHFTQVPNHKPHVEVKILPSIVYFADSLWKIDESLVTIDSSAISFNKLAIYNGKQRFMVDGVVSKNEEDIASIKIENIDMTLFEPLLAGEPVSGEVNGYAYVSDVYNKQKLHLDLRIDDLFYQSGYLGDLVLGSNWDNSSEQLLTELYLIKNDSLVLEGSGTIVPKDNKMDMEFGLHGMPISLLEVLMSPDFNQQKGFAEGKVSLSGHFNDLHLNGKLYPIGEASIGLTYLKTVYYTSNPITFADNKIIFDNMRVRDAIGNRGRFNGYISHKNFRKMVYQLDITADKVQVMNTTFTDNEDFYGVGFASGEVSITGQGENVFLTGNLKTEKGTQIYIPLVSTSGAVQHDFIHFVSKSKQEDKKGAYSVFTNGVDMNFDVEVTPDAKIQFIINSQMGEVINGQGRGDLNVHVDRKYNIEMYGNYEIEKGDYLFNLQNLINKKFTIEKGGSLKWVGDPYNAIVDITAMYDVNTTLSHLFAGTYSDIDLSRRIRVNCIIHLTENLMQPRIAFKIELPTAEERVKDEVAQMIVTEEDVNKQIISLLWLGHFYTPEFISGGQSTVTGAQLVGTTVGATVSELFTTQLTRWINQISNAWDVGIKYRPGNDFTNDQVELALSTQWLNDRITIDGNVANNANPTSTNSSSFIGDFDVNVRLTQNGKLQLKAYTHSNDNLIYNTAPNTQGVGITYKEEFNSFRELIKDYLYIFSRRKKKNSSETTKNEN